MKTILALLFVASVALAEEKRLPLLTSPTGAPLATNVTLSSSFGIRVVLRNQEGKVIAYDIDQISGTNLASLGIDPAIAAAKQKEIDDKKAAYRRQSAALAPILAAQQRARAEEMAKRSAEAEVQRKTKAFEDEVQRNREEAARKNEEAAALEKKRVESEIRENNARANYLNRTP